MELMLCCLVFAFAYLVSISLEDAVLWSMKKIIKFSYFDLQYFFVLYSYLGHP